MKMIDGVQWDAWTRPEKGQERGALYKDQLGIVAKDGMPVYFDTTMDFRSQYEHWLREVPVPKHKGTM